MINVQLSQWPPCHHMHSLAIVSMSSFYFFLVFILLVIFSILIASLILLASKPRTGFCLLQNFAFDSGCFHTLHWILVVSGERTLISFLLFLCLPTSYNCEFWTVSFYFCVPHPRGTANSNFLPCISVPPTPVKLQILILPLLLANVPETLVEVQIMTSMAGKSYKMGQTSYTMA